VSSDETPDAYAPLSGQDWPTIPPLAEVVVSASASAEPTSVTLEGRLATPVTVTEAGTLWLGYEYVESVDDDAASRHIQCASVCAEGDLEGWAYLPEGNRWGREAGWTYNTDVPDLRAVVAY
jgi:hypothetical protein